MTHKNPTRPTVIHFSPKLHQALKEIAEARGVSVTSLVIRACDEFVYGQNTPEFTPPPEVEAVFERYLKESENKNAS